MVASFHAECLSSPSAATFADHIIRGVAGRGGMGVVYRAVHLALKREVALKVIGAELSAHAEFRARFQRECETAASIQHPRVVPIYHAGEEDGLLYVTMRFVEGTDLSRALMARGRLDAEDARADRQAGRRRAAGRARARARAPRRQARQHPARRATAPRC